MSYTDILERIASATPDVICYVDPAYRYVYVNDAFLDFWGRTRENTIGKTVAEVVGTEFFDTVQKPWLDRCLSGEPAEFDFKFEQEGTRKHFHCVYTPDTQADGSVTGAVAAIRETTNLTDALRTLREKEAILSDISRNLPGALFEYVVHPDGSDSIQYMSDGCMDIWELSSRELMSDPTPLWNMILPDELEPMADSVRRSAEKLSRWEHRWHIKTASGTLKSLYGVGTPKALEDGSVLWNSIILDMTAVQRMEERHEAIFNHAALAFALVSLDGIVLEVNPKICELLGFEEEELTGKHFSSVTHPDDLQSGLDGIQSLIEGKRKSFTVETRFIRNDGKEIWGKLTCALVHKPDGSPDYLVTITHNITDQKDSERALARYRNELEELVAERTQEVIEARKQAEAASASKSAFLAHMSHEIRTPMNGIIGMTHLALQSGLDETQKNYVKKAHRSAQGLLGIINDILDFSKIEAGELELEYIPLKLPEIAANSLELVEISARERNIDLSIDYGEGMAEFFEGDPLRIGQVLTNLVANAVKFSEENGSVNIGLQVAERDGDKATVLFTVKDQGIGIPPDIKANLFKPFSQADISTTRKYGGTGLGLKICKQLVDLMGGEIGVESQQGLGSTFHFSLPLRVSGANAAEPAAVEQQDETRLETLDGARMLLVEDDEISQEVARKLLVKAGVTVHTAVNGLEALNVLENHRVDAVLMDCMMPVMDGYEATEKLRQNPNFSDLPVIAMTGNAMKEDVEKALAAGMNDHIAKPVIPDEMMSTLAKWISPGS